MRLAHVIGNYFCFVFGAAKGCASVAFDSSVNARVCAYMHPTVFSASGGWYLIPSGSILSLVWPSSQTVPHQFTS